MQPHVRIRTLGRIHTTLFALGVGLVVGSGLGTCTCACTCGLGLLLAFVGEGLLQHADVLVQLVVELLRTPHLAFLLRDLGLHLCALNVPCVSCTLVVVPFELEKSHHTCPTISPVLCPAHGPPISPGNGVQHTLQCVLCPRRRIAIAAAVRAAAVHGRGRLPGHDRREVGFCRGALSSQ